MAASTTTTFSDLLVRDYAEPLDLLIAKNAGFLSIIDTGEAATNIKTEWAEDSLIAETDTNTAAILVGDTNIQVADSSKFEVGAIITVELASGAANTERMRVTVIVDATNITVVRNIDGGGASAYAINSTIKIVSRPRPENENPSGATSSKPTTAFNICEIFMRRVEVSNSLQASNVYAVGENTLNYQVGRRMEEIVREMNRAAIYGVRDDGSVSGRRQMGGLLHYATKTSLGGPLTSASQINDIVKASVDSGVVPDTLVCNTDIARKISAFNSGSSLQTTLQDETAGNVVKRFQGDMPISGILRLVVDTDFPRSFLGIVDSTRIRRRWLRTMVEEPATLPGQDGLARVLRGEATLEFKNGSAAQRVLTGITLP